MEFIVINGAPLMVPPEVVSAGRDAVDVWHQAQLHPLQPLDASPDASPVAPLPEED